MTQAKKKTTKKHVSPPTTRQEEIHTHLYSAEHLGRLLERQGLLQSDNPREQPWCFYLDNPSGNLVCIFDSGNAARIVLRILRNILYPNIPEMMNAGDAEARDPNEVGLEMVIKRQEVWMKYFSESYNLLHKHFAPVFSDAMMRLVEEVLEVIIPELEGQGEFVFTEPIGKYLLGIHEFSEERKRGWLSPEERRRDRLKSLKSGRPVKRFRRPKGTGRFRSKAEFLVALRECFDSSSGRPPEIWLVKQLKEHRYYQHPKNLHSEDGTLDGQRRTLRHWLQRSGLEDIEGAIRWHQRIKEAESQQAERAVIKRKVGMNPETGEEYPFVQSITVSFRSTDPTTNDKEMFMRSTQHVFDPQESQFEVDAATAKAALATGGFERVANSPATRKRKKR